MVDVYSGAPPIEGGTVEPIITCIISPWKKADGARLSTAIPVLV